MKHCFECLINYLVFRCGQSFSGHAVRGRKVVSRPSVSDSSTKSSNREGLRESRERWVGKKGVVHKLNLNRVKLWSMWSLGSLIPPPSTER